MWQALIDNSGAVVAVFTIVLAVTTIVYVVMSVKLLKQSKNTLLADIFLRVMGTYWAEIKERLEGKKRGPDPIMEGWAEGYRKAFMEIDKKLGMDISKIMVVGFNAVYKALEEVVEKLEKENKKGKGSGTS